MFSKRLIEIASLVPVHSTVVDVGCDHGLLDIYLTLNRNCTCTAADINENCLKQAKDNFKKYSLTNKIKTVLSDGLTNVEYNKEDVIIIAGMGTNTILKILEEHDLENVIVQTNTDLVTFREAITDKYIIEDERVVKERGIYYVIMKLKKGTKNYKFEDYLLGPIIKKTAKYNDYHEHLLNKYTDIYNNVPKSQVNKKLEYRLYIKTIKKYCK